jgi:hypothetical protein
MSPLRVPCCTKCGRELTHDETALYRKLINRGAETFLCIDCLSERTGWPVPLLKKAIDDYRKQGCSLFA